MAIGLECDRFVEFCGDLTMMEVYMFSVCGSKVYRVCNHYRSLELLSYIHFLSDSQLCSMYVEESYRTYGHQLKLAITRVSHD